MFVVWTTLGQRGEAEKLASEVVTQGLAACVQIDGPVVSHYRWSGRPERAEEFRLTFKCVETQLGRLEAHVLANHPYEIPEWVVVRAEQVGEKYLSWAKANSTPLTL